MSYTEVIDWLAIIGAVIALFYFVRAYRRFLKGEFTEIMKWIISGIVLMMFFIAFIEAGEIFKNYEEGFHLLAHIIGLLGVIAFIKAAYMFEEFSKVYGFAEEKKK